MEASELSASVTSRIPHRVNRDDRYFTDEYQYMPKYGYTELFRRMLDHPLITVELGIDFFDIRGEVDAGHIVYTGQIDRFYDYCFGKLPYRSLVFEYDHFPNEKLIQPVAQVNYPNEHRYTRISEFKHMTGQDCLGTTLAKEYPSAEGYPYYPIPCPENQDLYNRYKELSSKEEEVTFVGRLAQYRYYNMDMIVSVALRTSEEILKKLER